MQQDSIGLEGLMLSAIFHLPSSSLSQAVLSSFSSSFAVSPACFAPVLGALMSQTRRVLGRHTTANLPV